MDAAKPLPAFAINSRTTGAHLGTYEVASREEALDAMTRSNPDVDPDAVVVTEIVEITPDA